MKNLLFTFSFLSLFLSTSLYPQWIQQNSGTTNRFLTCYFLNENTGWAAGYDGTIMKTSNGGLNWISKNIGTLDDVHDIFFRDSLNGWAILYEFSPFRHGSIINTTDGGNSWNVQFNVWDYTFHSIHFSDDYNGWVAGSNGIVYHTTNGGISWLQQFPPTGGAWLWPIFFIDNNVGWTAGDPLFGLYKSTSGGNSWLSYSVPVVERIHSIIFLDYQTGWLCGTQGQIAKSIDGGMTWENLQSGSSAVLRDIFFLDLNIGWCVGYNGTILHTMDGGANWYQQNSGTSSNLFGVHFANALTGWGVGDNGIILNTNNGGVPVELISFSAESIEGKIILKWTTATEVNNLGFEIERCAENRNWRTIGFVEGKGTTTQIQHYSFLDNLFEISQGKFYYRLKQVDYDGTYNYSKEVTIESIPNFDFILEQNYPNPFNPTTTIRYSIPERQFVTLRIYNSIGELVSELVNEEKEAGNYEFKFDASHLASGVYLYTIIAGNNIETKRMVLMK